MQTQQQQELYKLTDAATQLIETAPESGSFDHVFSYWRLPAFHDLQRTTLYSPKRPDSGKDSFVTITKWRRELDLDKLRDPVERLKHPKELEPTIEEASIVLEPDFVARVVGDLASVSLPSIRPDESIVGLDGIRYRFAFSSGYSSIDISWWCNHPKAWQEAAKQIEEVVLRVESAETTLTEQAGGGQAATRAEST